MTHDDVLYRFRLRLFALADELGNVRAACRILGVPPYYRCRKPPWLAQHIVALALAHPGWGPDRLAAELRRPRWGGHRRSPHGIWNVLRRAGLNTRAKRLGLIAGYQAPPESRPRAPEPVRHIEAAQPGDLVQLDCFHVGQLAGSRGRTWQDTAIDVATSYTLATLHKTPRNPAARQHRRLSPAGRRGLSPPRLAAPARQHR